jgi:hypothetical protein
VNPVPDRCVWLVRVILVLGSRQTVTYFIHLFIYLFISYSLARDVSWTVIKTHVFLFHTLSHSADQEILGLL